MRPLKLLTMSIRKDMQGDEARIYDIASAISPNPDDPGFEGPWWCRRARPPEDTARVDWPDDATLEKHERLESDTAEQWAELLQRGRALAEQWRQRELDLGDADRSRRRVEQLKGAGIPEKDLQSVIDRTLCETPAIAAARRAIEDGVVMVVLSGPVGIGKSTAGAWWLGELLTGEDIPIHRTYGARASEPAPLALRVKATALARWARFDEDAMRRLNETDLLVIDDFGQEYLDAKGALSSLIDEVIDARYECQRLTLITTNLGTDGFVERYGARFTDRLLEKNRFVSLTGESLRRTPPAGGTARRARVTIDPFAARRYPDGELEL